MKIKFIDNDFTIQILNSGISIFNNTLKLSVIKDSNTFDAIKEYASDNTYISLITDGEKFQKMYTNYSKLTSAEQITDYVIAPATYNADGSVATEEETGTVIVLTLAQGESSDDTDEEDETLTLSEQVAQNTADIEYLKMLAD